MGAGRTAINIAALGPLIRPTGKAEAAVRETEQDLHIHLLSGGGSPVFRAGGLVQLITPGITVGRSLMVGTDMESLVGVNRWAHESYHFYQQLTESIAGQLVKGMKEQWFLRTFGGVKVYNHPEFGDKYNESRAKNYADTHYPTTSR
jgi:hypothetical protein